jgi:hypothetical protein
MSTVYIGVASDSGLTALSTASIFAQFSINAFIYLVCNAK